MKINPVVSLFSTLLLSFGIIFLGSSNFQFQYYQLIPQNVSVEDQISMQKDSQDNESSSKIQKIETINEPNIEVSSEYQEKEANQKIEEDKSILPESDGAEIKVTSFSIYKTNEEIINSKSVPNVDMAQGCLVENALNDDRLWYFPDNFFEYKKSFYNIGIKVESGLNLDPNCLSNMVIGILNDPRGWSTIESQSFQIVNSENADLNIVFARPETVDELCYPLQTNGIYSCRNEKNVVINMFRWLSGAKDFGTDLSTYRIYLINHEVGHYLGWGHSGCPSDKALAPVMMQQSKSTNGCVPNGWPIYERIKLLYSSS
tara:strand:+ start:1458 stop:2405 length:948 start_codon:yes stop_codon:yes gene_type:complete